MPQVSSSKREPLWRLMIGKRMLPDSFAYRQFNDAVAAMLAIVDAERSVSLVSPTGVRLRFSAVALLVAG